MGRSKQVRKQHRAGAVLRQKLKIGYSGEKYDNLKSKIEELKKVFPAEEIEFLTSAAYRPELIAQFLK